MLKCPYCSYKFPLDWGLYLRTPFGKVHCPRCNFISWAKPPEAALFWRHVVIYMTIALVVTCAIVGLAIVYLPLAMSTRVLVGACVSGVICILVIIPMDKRFDSKHRQLTAKPGALAQRALDEGVCPVCHQPPSKDAVPFGELRVCATCKDEHVQRLREGVGD